MIDFLVLRLRGALQESWLEDAVALRLCVIIGQISFDDLCAFVRDLISVWCSVRKFSKDSNPRHIKTEAGSVRCFVCFLFLCSFVGR